MLSSSGSDGPVADLGGPVAEVAHVVEQFLGRLDGHGFRRALPVGARLEVRDGQGQVLGGLDVGGHVQHPQHFRDVGEPGEPAFHPEAAAAFGGQLDLGDDLAERRRPGVEDLDARGLPAGPGRR